MSCRLSLNFADAFTASSDITPPNSCTRCLICSVSSAEVLRRAPNSVAPRPRSCPAKYVRCVSLSTFCKAVIVFENSSSLLILLISSRLKPSAVNASLSVSAAFASVFIAICILSMLVPLCCIIADHS